MLNPLKNLGIRSTMAIQVIPALAILIFQLYYFSSICDDAFIFFRYLDNWLAGEGLVYNSNERVEGYTNFLWIIILAPLRLLGLSAELSSIILGVTCYLLLIVVVIYSARELTNSNELALGAGLLVGTSIHLAFWSVSGMGALLFTLLISLANYELFKNRKVTYRVALLYGLAITSRPTGVMYVFITFLFFLPDFIRSRNKREYFLTGLVLLALPLLQLIFRLSYYGEFFPNTFYAKIGGSAPGIFFQDGITYFKEFLKSGSIFLLIPALGLLFNVRAINKFVGIILIQIILHTLYNISIGGDYFPFSRFFISTIPMLVLLAVVGLKFLITERNLKLSFTPIIFLALVATTTVFGNSPRNHELFTHLKETREERELVARWIKKRLAPDELISVNAAGLIPYRTGLPTIDMLGLNDAHIARQKVNLIKDGAKFVGHYKHDARYVCERKPRLVLLSGGRLYHGRTGEEAMFEAALVNFVGDREFLRNCGYRYQAVAEMLLPGKYIVAYILKNGAINKKKSEWQPQTARGWFKKGLEYMRYSKLEQAIESFKMSLELDPQHTEVYTNIGYAYFDLSQLDKAVEYFKRALTINYREYDAHYGLGLAYRRQGLKDEARQAFTYYIQNAPDSTWKEKARKNLNMLEAE